MKRASRKKEPIPAPEKMAQPDAAGPTPQPAPKRRGGRPSQPILDAELVAAALAELHGNVAATAKRFNVARASVFQLIGKRPALQKVLADAREGMIDHAESALYRAVGKGEAWAVCFYLKTQGKSRGYIERNEVEHSGFLDTPLSGLIVRRRDGETKAQDQADPVAPAADS